MAALSAALALVPSSYAQTKVVKKGETVTAPFNGYLIEDKTGRECLLCNDLLKVSRDRRAQCEEARVTECQDSGGPSALVWGSVGGAVGVVLTLVVMSLAK